MSKEVSAKIESLQQSIEDALSPFVDHEPFSLVDFPDHANVGDSAIWLGETTFFRRRRLWPSYVSSLKTHRFDDRKSRLVKTVFLHGGGNFGTVWPDHQAFRLEVLKRYKGTRIVQLPQSIHFADDAGIEETAKAIVEHGQFVLMVRDRPSFELASRKFECEVLLCPDMAFQMGSLRRWPAAIDALCLLRTDKEKVLTARPAGSNLRISIEDWLTDDVDGLRRGKLRELLVGLPHRRGSLSSLFEGAARARVRRGARQLSKGRIVITDRLHGHILSTLLDIPQILLDNSYGKISNFVGAWTSDLEFVRRVESFEAAVQLGSEMVGSKAPR